MKTLGGRGRCHWNIHIFCCTSSPTEELDAEFSYYYLPNFLISDQLNRKFHIEIRLVDNFKLLKIDLSIKNSFKCTHARMSVCLYSLLIRNISKFGIYPKMPVLSAKRDHFCHERRWGHNTKTQRKREKLYHKHKQPRLKNFNQNFPRENWTLKNRELFGWIAIILFDRGRGRDKEYLEITIDESRVKRYSQEVLLKELSLLITNYKTI